VPRGELAVIWDLAAAINVCRWLAAADGGAEVAACGELSDFGRPAERAVDAGHEVQGHVVAAGIVTFTAMGRGRRTDFMR
jgi:hypothetical protein